MRNGPNLSPSTEQVSKKSLSGLRISCSRLVCVNIAVHFYRERKVIGRPGVPVLQLGRRRKLVGRRVDFDRVEKNLTYWFT